MFRFHERLKELRKRRGMTMEQLGREVGVAKSTIAGYESGKREPTLHIIHLLAKSLSTTTDYLLGLTEAIEPTPLNSNAREYLNTKELHWDGVKLNEEDLEPIKQLLELLVRERLHHPQNHNAN